MDIEEVIRFTVPGSIALLPVALWFLHRPVLRDGAGAFWAAVTAMAVVAVGYTIHQIWMCYYRKRWHEQRESVGDIAKLIEKESDRDKVREALLVWEYFAHSKYCEEGLRDHDKRSWYFVHSLMSAFVACLLVAALLGVILLRRPGLIDCSAWIMPRVFVVYFVFTLFFYCRGRQARDDVVNFERQIVKQKQNIIEWIITKQPTVEKTKRGCLLRIVGRS